MVPGYDTSRVLFSVAVWHCVANSVVVSDSFPGGGGVLVCYVSLSISLISVKKKKKKML